MGNYSRALHVDLLAILFRSGKKFIDHWEKWYKKVNWNYQVNKLPIFLSNGLTINLSVCQSHVCLSVYNPNHLSTCLFLYIRLLIDGYYTHISIFISLSLSIYHPSILFYLSTHPSINWYIWPSNSVSLSKLYPSHQSFYSPCALRNTCIFELKSYPCFFPLYKSPLSTLHIHVYFMQDW